MSLTQNIISQFKQPHGFIGHFAGYIMSKRPSNINRNQWTIDLLNLQEDDNVLEFGFGPGLALQTAADIVSSGQIVGIDHSEVMLSQASKRNQHSINTGLMSLHLGDIKDIPSDVPLFNKIYSANVVMFWQNPQQQFELLLQHLAPEGTIATTYMPRHQGATADDSSKMAEQIVQDLTLAGFVNIRVETRYFDKLPTICVLASKSDVLN